MARSSLSLALRRFYGYNERTAFGKLPVPTNHIRSSQGGALYLRQKTNEYRLLTELYFRLLPYQVLLLAINAVNGIVDTLYASNVI